MNSSHWELVTKIFVAAVEIPRNARNDFVRQECKGDTELETDVFRLLAADEQAGSFLERLALRTPPPPSTPTSTLPLLSPGSIVSGRFEILRFIGQGGM